MQFVWYCKHYIQLKWIEISFGHPIINFMLTLNNKCVWIFVLNVGASILSSINFKQILFYYKRIINQKYLQNRNIPFPRRMSNSNWIKMIRAYTQPNCAHPENSASERNVKLIKASCRSGARRYILALGRFETHFAVWDCGWDDHLANVCHLHIYVHVYPKSYRIFA